MCFAGWVYRPRMFSIERLYHALAANAREGRWPNGLSRQADSRPLNVEQVLKLPTGEHPEGVAVDRVGNVYVSNRRFAGPVRQAEIIRVSKEGAASVLVKLPDTTDPQGNGVLGLVTDRGGNIYAALDSRDPSSRGVWRVQPDGSTLERLPGSEHMSFPNALIFDAVGNLYATDSQQGAIWRFPLPDPETPAPWIQDELLAPFSFDPFGIPLPNGDLRPFPLPGANGIAFYPPNHLYVANTERGLLVHVPFESDGHAGKARIIAGEPVTSDPEAWLPDPRLWTMDGIAVDAEGHIYGVVPGCVALSQVTGLPLAPLVRINTASGEISGTPAPPNAFHVPLSLAFGRGAQDCQSVYVTNAALLADLFPGAGPGVVRVELGVPGFQVEAGSVGEVGA